MIVQTNQPYPYKTLEEDLLALQETYPLLSVFSIGESVKGRQLYGLKLGTGPKEVFYNGAHHALEWITSLFLMKSVEEILQAQKKGTRLAGYDVSQILELTTIYIVPMVNPDGVELVLNGLSKDDPSYADLVRWNDGNPDFSKTWQANFHGVDLNHNYDADFEKSRPSEEALGIYGPHYTRYAGPRPFSEPETRAVSQFTAQHDFQLVIAYHTQGQVIYYDFDGKEPPESIRIGRLLAQETGYLLAQPEGIASFGGYKDWFIEMYRRPGYTIEQGIGKNPLPLSQFDPIYRANLPALLLAASIA